MCQLNILGRKLSWVTIDVALVRSYLCEVDPKAIANRDCTCYRTGKPTSVHELHPAEEQR